MTRIYSWPNQVTNLSKKRLTPAVSFLILCALLIVWLWIAKAAGTPALLHIGEEIPQHSGG
jgi:hypothetical protein